MSTTTHRPAGPALLDLPGQTHVAEGPLDLNGMYLAHHAFRRDLASFAAAAAGTPVGEIDVWRGLAVRWERFSHVLHHHHTTEDDVLWPQLLDLVDADGDTAGRATLEAMEAEHQLIDPLLAACAEGFARMADRPDEETRSRLAGTTRQACDVLGEHLRHEETGALPIVQRLLPQEGWDRVEEAAGSGATFARTRFLVPWVADGLTPEQRDTAFSSVGNGFRVLLWFTRRRYARETALAFRYA
ncbi:hemerythrin domain-containing protein [Blastococcus sp. TF02A-30]|uniref:hemerythrin domain-containing protein n=1 Tax=Blastococcus sp. TF02A-30 TaxID=2250580 RepID=UPI000DEAA7F4|nr:hemerythrin domain-containing protein [Blastococcus sp. TF02A-30]RBY86271.1 hemerythrin domain-containing protein [Blastococcus sp. TF02A-30]